MIAAGAWAILAAASLLIGAVVALTVRVPPQVVGDVMGFGAGALVAALAYELIPTSHVADWLIWVNFGIGALVFYGLDSVLERRSATGSGAGVSIALGALLDGVPESIVLGVGVAVGGNVSIGFLVAVLVSNVPESLSSTADLRKTHSAAWIYRLWAAIVACSGLAAILGYALASHLSNVDGRYVQALAAGSVLTMLADSMMPEAFSRGGRRIALLTALGFAIAAFLTTLD
ncbi:ZIP family metal transporter [Dactylosporangium cerinum]|uniref:ZIP family metal transporter n=1 Tax=Dactylosporangium cerinum TaxID=1434730 RepID=A0ABV9W438_9ACTN